MKYQMLLDRIGNDSKNREGCFAFSIHKSGSSLMNGMIETVCNQSGIPALTVPDVLFMEGILDKDWQSDPEIVSVFRRRMLFFGFRYLPPILNDPSIGLDRKKFVLLIRDPRDALVSEYFSYGRSRSTHVTPAKNVDAFKMSIAHNDDIGIDAHVLRASDMLLTKLMLYKDNLNFKNGLLFHYEKVYYDKMEFLESVFFHFGFSVKRSILEAAVRQYDIRPTTEDQSRHIRKGAPGDHVSKLRPETIKALNDKFWRIGLWYGYDLRGDRASA